MRKKTHKHQALRRGQWAENIVCATFWCLGYKILARRLKTPVAEIDLLLQHRFFATDQLLIVEVKFRQKMADAIEALSWYQYSRLQTAALWLEGSRYMKGKNSVRIDYVALSWDAWPHRICDV